MKVRVLYPLALAYLPKPPAAGDVITLEDDVAARAIEVGYVEPVGKPAVERATAAPGEKRKPGRPKKTATPPKPKGE
jgi:hypothetical protein